MPAALGQNSGATRGDHRVAEIEAGHRAAGALADPVRRPDDEHRPSKTLDQAACDDADNARMPPFAGDDDDRGVVLLARDIGGSRRHRAFERAAATVELIKQRGDRPRLGLIVFHEETRGQ